MTGCDWHADGYPSGEQSRAGTSLAVAPRCSPIAQTFAADRSRPRRATSMHRGSSPRRQGDRGLSGARMMNAIIKADLVALAVATAGFQPSRSITTSPCLSAPRSARLPREPASSSAVAPRDDPRRPRRRAVPRRHRPDCRKAQRHATADSARLAAPPHRHRAPDPRHHQRRTHFHENLAAANISLTQDEVDAVTALAPED